MLCEKRQCTGCRACESICAFQSITMKEDAEGFLYPEIDPKTCTQCGLCEKTCPVLNDPVFSKISEPGIYACWSHDEDVRGKSSSGGVFSLLAKRVLEKGGVVFGAAFDSNYRVHHTYIENYSEIDRLRRSKYVQSDTEKSFKEAEAFLKAGRAVLYVGTPCQVAGLQSYLRKPYENLVTCSFVCYGVPSPKVWKSYLNYRTPNKKIKAISFRDKENSGWRNYTMRMDYDDGSSYRKLANQDAYFIGFGRNLFSRPSCFDCRFRYQNTKSDITLADFWGIDKLPGIDVSDDKGVSLVLTNTQKGENWIEILKDNLFVQKRTFEEAARSNPKLVSSAKQPPLRALFFKELAAEVAFEKLVHRYMRNTGLKAELKKVIKSILGEERIKKLIG